MVYLLLVSAILFLPIVTEKIQHGKKIYFISVTLLLIFFAGFRDLSVGTDTKSYVTGFLNGVKIGESNNMFIRHEFKVDNIIKDGENTLTVHIKSAVLEAPYAHPEIVAHERLFRADTSG